MLLTRSGSHPPESVLLINKILGGQLETLAGKLMNPATRRRASGPFASLLKHHAYGIFEKSRNGVRGRNSEFSLREAFDFLTIDIPLYILETMENGTRRFAGDFRSYEWNIAEENVIPLLSDARYESQFRGIFSIRIFHRTSNIPRSCFRPTPRNLEARNKIPSC